MKVLFVCTGNICRSPFAERYAAFRNAQIGGRHTFSSAGVGAVIGSGMDELMSGELSRVGADDSDFVARQLAFEAVDGIDLVLALESAHRRAVIEDFPALHRKTFVLRTAARAAAQAPAGVDRFEHVLAVRPAVRRGDSIADPYRMGTHAASVAAREIVEAVDCFFD